MYMSTVFLSMSTFDAAKAAIAILVGFIILLALLGFLIEFLSDTRNRENCLVLVLFILIFVGLFLFFKHC